MNETLQIILKKMFEIIGEEYSFEKTQSDSWFLDYSWTAEQENQFRDWLVNYLYENKEARQSLMRWPRKNKKTCKRATNEFILWYGWKTLEVQ